MPYASDVLVSIGTDAEEGFGAFVEARHVELTMHGIKLEFSDGQGGCLLNVRIDEIDPREAVVVICYLFLLVASMLPALLLLPTCLVQARWAAVAVFKRYFDRSPR